MTGHVTPHDIRVGDRTHPLKGVGVVPVTCHVNEAGVSSSQSQPRESTSMISSLIRKLRQGLTGVGRAGRRNGVRPGLGSAGSGWRGSAGRRAARRGDVDSWCGGGVPVENRCIGDRHLVDSRPRVEQLLGDQAVHDA